MTKSVIEAIDGATEYTGKTMKYIQAIVKRFKKQFHKHIWSFRCELLMDWEKARGISKEDKRYKRRRSKETKEQVAAEKENKRPRKRMETREEERERRDCENKGQYS